MISVTRTGDGWKWRNKLFEQVVNNVFIICLIVPEQHWHSVEVYCWFIGWVIQCLLRSIWSNRNIQVKKYEGSKHTHTHAHARQVLLPYLLIRRHKHSSHTTLHCSFAHIVNHDKMFHHIEDWTLCAFKFNCFLVWIRSSGSDSQFNSNSTSNKTIICLYILLKNKGWSLFHPLFHPLYANWPNHRTEQSMSILHR